ncbi:MAG: hypothetical protein WBA74_00235 [Cyclobacteriaceae bacterium]
MKLKYTTGEEFFLKYNQFFHAVLAFSLLPFGIIFLAKKRGFQPDAGDPTVRYAIYGFFALIIVFLIVVAMRRYRESFRSYSKLWTLREKLDFFYAINFKKYIFYGMATIVAVAGYLYDDSFFFTIIYVGLLFIMSLGRPVERKIEKELGMTKEEIEIFRKKVEIP